MNELLKAFVSLLKVKSLMTLLVAVALMYGFVNGQIDGAQLMTVVMMVFTFYFARKEEL